MSALALSVDCARAEGQDQISVDTYLSRFRVMSASAFSLSLKMEGNSFEFEPILFGRRAVERSSRTDAPISEAESLLTDYQQDIFRNSAFVRP